MQDKFFSGLKVIEFSKDEVTRLWPLGKDKPVVLDPRRALGAATGARSGVPTRVLYGASLAGEHPEAIADWYDVELDEVRAAIQFERLVAPRRRAAA